MGLWRLDRWRVFWAYSVSESREITRRMSSNRVSLMPCVLESEGRQVAISRAHEVRPLALMVDVAMIPGGGTVAVIALTTQPDLNELTPVASHTAGFSLLGWESLLRDQPHALDAGSAIASGTGVEVLGCLMDGNRTVENGKWVQEFTLLPEAGNPSIRRTALETR